MSAPAGAGGAQSVTGLAHVAIATRAADALAGQLVAAPRSGSTAGR